VEYGPVAIVIAHGMGQQPPVFLRPGNRVRLGIHTLGEQSQLVTATDGSM